MPSNLVNVKSVSQFPDSRLSASSSLDDLNAEGRPERAVLNNKQGSWCSFYKRQGEWLQVDLGLNQDIYGVAVQGSNDSTSIVTNYTVGLRANGATEGTWLLETVGFKLLKNNLCLNSINTPFYTCELSASAFNSNDPIKVNSRKL